MRPEIIHGAVIESILVNANAIRRQGFSPEGALFNANLQAINGGINKRNLERIEVEIRRRLISRGYLFEDPDVI